MSESELQTVCVLLCTSKDEDWQMWSMKFCMHRMYKGYNSILDSTLTVPTLDELLKEKDNAVVKAGQMTIKLNKDGYVDLMLSMSNVKSFSLVKEHEGNLYNAWKALLEEFEPQTEISLIELLSELDGNKLMDPKSNVTEWMSLLELQCQHLKAMGHNITDDHLIMHILANSPKECAVMMTQLYQVLCEKN